LALYAVDDARPDRDTRAGSEIITADPAVLRGSSPDADCLLCVHARCRPESYMGGLSFSRVPGLDSHRRRCLRSSPTGTLPMPTQLRGEVSCRVGQQELHDSYPKWTRVGSLGPRRTVQRVCEPQICYRDVYDVLTPCEYRSLIHMRLSWNFWQSQSTSIFDALSTLNSDWTCINSTPRASEPRC